MADATSKKCAHEQCKCTVPANDKYCSDYCKDAQSEREVELQCDCKHAACDI